LSIVRKNLNFRPSEGQEGQFRLLLTGTEHINVKIDATDILPIPEMEIYEISGQFRAGGQISLQKNSCCSAWIDIPGLVMSQDLDVTDKEGTDVHEQFVEDVMEAQQTLGSVGLSWRWALAAKQDGSGLELQLQGMPCSGAYLTSQPTMCKDNVPVIVLAQTDVDCAMFDGTHQAGPVPVLFSSDPTGAAKQLTDNPALAHAYCQALSARLFAPEALSALEAMAWAQGPREGKGESPFIREWTSPQQKRKKPNTAADLGPVGDSQGNNITLRI
jgi:hypothetical protein